VIEIAVKKTSPSKVVKKNVAFEKRRRRKTVKNVAIKKRPPHSKNP